MGDVYGRRQSRCVCVWALLCAYFAYNAYALPRP